MDATNNLTSKKIKCTLFLIKHFYFLRKYNGKKIIKNNTRTANNVIKIIAQTGNSLSFTVSCCVIGLETTPFAPVTINVIVNVVFSLKSAIN